MDSSVGSLRAAGSKATNHSDAACFLCLPSFRSKRKLSNRQPTSSAKPTTLPCHACGLALLGPWIDPETDRPLVEQHIYVSPPLLHHSSITRQPTCLPDPTSLPRHSTYYCRHLGRHIDTHTHTHTWTNTTATSTTTTTKRHLLLPPAIA